MDKRWSIAAANAITILVRAGIRFIGTDLNGVRISGADLSYGIFDSAQLQGADLRKTCLQGAWLRDANLTEARMDEAVFGEWPALSDEKMEGAFAYSPLPDGSMFLAGTERGSIHLYNTTTWSSSPPLEGHVKPVRHIKFSPNGSTVATGGDDNTVILWDLKTSQRLHIMKSHKKAITGLAFSICGRQLASCSKDDTVLLWEVWTGKLEGTIEVPNAWADWRDWDNDDYRNHFRCDQTWTENVEVSDVAYSPDGKVLATCFVLQSLQLWSLETRKSLHDLSEFQQAVNGLVFSIDGKQILSSGFDGSVIAWDTATGEKLWRWKEENKCIRSMSYSPHGQQIVCVSEDGVVSLLDGVVNLSDPSRTPLGLNLQGHVGNVFDAVYSSDGLWIVTAGEDRTVRLWDAQRGISGPVLSGHTDSVHRVTISPNGLQIASGGGGDGLIRLWDTQPSSIHHRQSQFSRGHLQVVEEVQFLLGRGHISSLSGDSACIWDRHTGILRHRLEFQGCEAQSMEASPCGLELAVIGMDTITGSGYYYLYLFDLQTGVCKEGVSVLGYPERVSYSADGLWLAITFSQDFVLEGGGFIQIWNRHTVQLEAQLYTSVMPKVIFSPSHGCQLAIAGGKGVSLWDVSTNKLQHQLEFSQVYSLVAYSPDGSTLWTCSQGTGLIQSWDTATGDCIKTTKIEPVFPKIFSQDGSKLIAYAQLDKGGIIVKVFDVMTGQLLWILGDATKEMLADMSADGQMLATCLDGNVQVWNLSDGCKLAEIVNLKGYTICWDKTTPASATTSTIQENEGEGREGNVLVIGHADGDLSVWKLIRSDRSKFKLSSSSLIHESYYKKAEEAKAKATLETTQKNRKEDLAGNSRKQKRQNKAEEKEQGTKHRLVLGWTSAFGRLNAQGTLIHNVKGLSAANVRLLMQNGAKGESVMCHRKRPCGADHPDTQVQ
ncbi:snoRNA-binding rRNA-processing protein [Dissophora globulifera]|nr:snoRNA-binding rRNA-processing protein [Dissophora globulifera]